MAGSIKGLIAAFGTLALLAFLPAAARAEHPLEPDRLDPDLITVDLSAGEMSIEERGNRTLLRLANRVGNIGAGPLEIRSDGQGPGCDAEGEVRGFQRTYEKEWSPAGPNTEFEDQEIGCIRYHPSHFHWHVTSIARYTLVDEETGVPVDGNKVGFCLGDSGHIEEFPSAQPFYSFDGCGSGPDTLPTITGISPGFFDLYGPSTAGQRINVTGLERGRYCVRSEANPTGEVHESDPQNNVDELRVRLNPERQRVTGLAGPCVSSP